MFKHLFASSAKCHNYTNVQKMKFRELFIVVYFDPITIRVLEIDLQHTIGAQLRLFGVALPVAVFDMRFILVFHKIRQRCHVKTKVDIDFMSLCRAIGSDYMQRHTIADSKPLMHRIMKRIGYFLQLHYITVKSHALFQVVRTDGQVVNGWLIALPKNEAGYRKDQYCYG